MAAARDCPGDTLPQNPAIDSGKGQSDCPARAWAIHGSHNLQNAALLCKSIELIKLALARRLRTTTDACPAHTYLTYPPTEQEQAVPGPNRHRRDHLEPLVPVASAMTPPSQWRPLPLLLALLLACVGAQVSDAPIPFHPYLRADRLDFNSAAQTY